MTGDDGELNLHHFFEHSPDLMTVAGLDGYFKVLNPVWTDVLGWDLGELMAEPFGNFVHPEDLDATRAELAKLAEGALTIAFENRYRCRDGSFRWLQWNATPRSGLIYAVARDITKGRETESSLRRSERFLDSIIDHIPNMVFVKDSDQLRFVRVNRAGENLLGFTSDELSGKNDFDFFPEDEARFFVSTDRGVLAAGEVVDIPHEQIETRYLGRRTLHTKKIPLHDDHGEPAFLLGIAEDITDRVEDQDRLRERQETLDAIFDASPDAIVMLNREQRIEHISDSIADIDGFPAGVRHGRSPLDRVHPDDLSAMDEAVRALGAGTGAVMNVRFRLAHADGHWVPVEARGRALHDSDRIPSGAVVVLRDITESLAAQEALEKAQVGEAEHRLVEELQRRSVQDPPPTTGLDMSGHYRPARSELGMGGDWYQGLRLDNGRLALVVGDVVGHGLAAAGDMTQLSGMIATLLRAGTVLEDLFSVLHDALGTLDIMATVVVCEIDPATRALRHVSAGHPPLVIASADGTSSFLTGGRRPPIGVPAGPVPVAETLLPIGCTLVAYTDGLLERRDESLDVGMSRLQDGLATAAGLEAEEILGRLVSTCTDGHDAEDDIAVVVVRSIDA